MKTYKLSSRLIDIGAPYVWGIQYWLQPAFSRRSPGATTRP
jgi:hypothetical protein